MASGNSQNIIICGNRAMTCGSPDGVGTAAAQGWFPAYGKSAFTLSNHYGLYTKPPSPAETTLLNEK
jgi:hypothetical protein